MKNKIGIIGVGRLGICFALLLEKAGYHIVASDINHEYVDLLNKKQINTHEPDVATLLEKSVNISFTTDNKEVFQQCDFVYVMVATPSLSDGSYNISAVNTVVDDIANYQFDLTNKTVIIGCTTNPGDCSVIQQKLDQFGMNVLYNPEFIAQGSIIHDLQHSDLVLLGGANQWAIEQWSKIYNEIQIIPPNICVMSSTAAEVVKISINAFLTMKISFANMIGQALTLSGCEKDTQLALHAIGSDSRIGKKYLNYGFGYGGPCLPRDNRSLACFFEKNGLDFSLGKNVDNFNKNHVTFLTETLITKNTNQLPFFLESIAYKKDSDIVEESHQLQLCKNLLSKGHTVYVKDTAQLSNALKFSLKSCYENLHFVSFDFLQEHNIRVYKIDL